MPTKFSVAHYLRVFKAKHVKNANKAICGMLHSIVQYTHGLRCLGSSSAHCGGMLGRCLPMVVNTLVAGTDHIINTINLMHVIKIKAIVNTFKHIG